MTVKKIEKIFDNEIGTKTIVLHDAPNSVNACSSIGISIQSGSVSVGGKVAADSEQVALGMIDLLTGNIVSVGSVGAYSVLGAETLHSVTITAEENTTATAKFVY